MSQRASKLIFMAQQMLAEALALIDNPNAGRTIAIAEGHAHEPFIDVETERLPVKILPDPAPAIPSAQEPPNPTPAADNIASKLSDVPGGSSLTDDELEDQASAAHDAAAALYHELQERRAARAPKKDPVEPAQEKPSPHQPMRDNAGQS